MPETDLTDDALRERIRAIKRDEEQISYERRMLHGRIDVVRSEILSRLDRRAGIETEGSDPLADLVHRLTEALTHKGPPPIDAELERFGAGPTDESTAGSADLDDELPQLSDLPDGDLSGLVRSLTERERQASARRQELHHELDELRAEHVSRLQTKYADSAEG